MISDTCVCGTKVSTPEHVFQAGKEERHEIQDGDRRGEAVEVFTLDAGAEDHAGDDEGEPAEADELDQEGLGVSHQRAVRHADGRPGDEARWPSSSPSPSALREGVARLGGEARDVERHQGRVEEEVGADVWVTGADETVAYRRRRGR